jgi:hypothetical protein
MSASKAEGWAFRCLLALINNNVQIPDGIEKTGMAGLAQIGIQGLGGLPWFVAEPLLREMMECVQIIPDYPKFNVPRALNDGDGAQGSGDYDIEEVQTRMMLRWEVFKLHTDFSEAALQSLIERAKVMAAGKKDSTIATASQE